MTQLDLPELSAMQQIANIVADLTPAERRRVGAWLVEFAKEDVPLATKEPAATISDSDPALTEPDTDVAQDKAYTTFAELYEAVAPRKGAQKAAVAGYWLETTNGQESWKASEVNKLLKSIDVKVSSMSIVLTNAVKATNALVIELERLGDTERSRKTFRLSEHGLAYVRSQLA